MSDAVTWALIALLAAAAIAFAVAWWQARTRGSRRQRARLLAAQRGEQAAETLLTSQGFRVIARQQTATWTMWVNGQPVQVTSRADLLVEAHRHPKHRRGCRFVAEVKTGSTAPDPTHPATRRQLMEYERAFDVDGLLLVDMAEARVLQVAFDEPE